MKSVMTQSPLSLQHLHKSYGEVQAVRGVDLEMKTGEVLGLLGPNGAGKTSIISMITGLEKPTSGQVIVFGADVQKDPRRAKMLVGRVPQEIVGHGFFNVDEVLGFLAGYYGVTSPRDRIEYLIDRLALGPHRAKKVNQLSGGMKRRLMIAKALIHEPRLLLLDEPTAGVDVELRSSLWKFVRELQSAGISILLTTHYLEEAEKLCDRVAIIHLGLIRAMGPTQHVIREVTQRTDSNLEDAYLKLTQEKA